MLHAKFQDHRDSDYDKEVFKAFYHIWRGVHLGHATLGISFVPNSEEDA